MRNVSPYRLPACTTDDASTPRADLGFAWVGAIVWATSLARVVVSAFRREPIDQEVSLALLLLLAIPWGFRRAFTKS